MTFVIQARYWPGSTLAEALSTGQDWEDVSQAKPGVTRDRAEEVLALTQSTFSEKEWRLIEIDACRIKCGCDGRWPEHRPACARCGMEDHTIADCPREA